MGFTVAERQKKYRKIRREKNLALVQVWVPKDRVVEIKTIVKSTQINRHFRLVMPYKLVWQEHIQ